MAVRPAAAAKPSPAAALKAAKAGTKAAPKAAAPAPEPEPEPEPEAEVETQEEQTEETTAEEVGTTEDTIFARVCALALATDATFTAQGAKETEQDFLNRMMRVALEASDEGYEALGEEAQIWYNDAGTAISAGKPIAACPGFSSMAPATADKPKRAGNTDALRAHQAKVKAEKELAIKEGRAPAVAPKKAAAPKEPKGEGLVGTIRRIVLANPALTSEQVMEAVKAKGLVTAMGTVSTTRAGTLDCLVALKEMGKLK